MSMVTSGTLLTAMAAVSSDENALLKDYCMALAVGLAVVFVALIVVSVVLARLGKSINRDLKRVDAEVPVSVSMIPVYKMADATGLKASAVPSVQNGISDEVVAVIAAAVASMAPEGTHYAVRSVSRARGDRPVWAAAGLAESTRPF